MYHTRPFYRSARSKPPPWKVVTIPVLDGNDRPPAGVPALLADSAALRMQRAFRGFLARKSVGAVRELERQVEEMERRIEATRELLARDRKERVRTGEALMAILLRLDSVRGARDYRRKVVRRAVALQDSLEAEEEEEDSLEAEKAEEDSLEAEKEDEKEEEEEEEEDSLKAEKKEDEKEEEAEEERGDGDREGAEDAVGRVREVMEALARRVEELERRVRIMENGRRKRRSAAAVSRGRSRSRRFQSLP